MYDFSGKATRPKGFQERPKKPLQLNPHDYAATPIGRPVIKVPIEGFS